MRHFSSLPDAAEHIAISPNILYVGTPVALLCSENADGSFNLAPMSSVWALGQTVVLGLSTAGQTGRNLAERPDLVVNFPEPGQWQAVERLAPLTGRFPVPEGKRDRSRFEPDKFAAAGVTPQPAELVRPPRVRECPLQFEARTVRMRTDAAGNFLIIEADVLKVHARQDLVVPGTSYIDPDRWSPLIYNFRHYHGLGEQLGHSFRSDTPRQQSLETAPPVRRSGGEPPPRRANRRTAR